MHEVIASKSGLIATAASQRRIASDPATVRDPATEIEWAKVMEVGPADYSPDGSASRAQGSWWAQR